MVFSYVGCAALAYAIGTISWALVIGKVFYRTDIRESGSGNLGATNVYRVLGWKPALAVLLLDAGKGILAMWLAATVLKHPSASIMLLIMMSVIAGHTFPFYLHWKGGKGIAPGAGALFYQMWPVALVLLVIFVLAVALTRVVAIGSTAIAGLFWILVYLYTLETWPAVIAFAMGAMVIWLHRENWVRIWNGQEKQLTFQKDPA